MVAAGVISTYVFLCSRARRYVCSERAEILTPWKAIEEPIASCTCGWTEVRRFETYSWQRQALFVQPAIVYLKRRGPRMSAKRIDLNVDLGEGFPHDAELLAYATSVNVACGGTRGNPLTMRRVTSEAIRRGVAIGAHPSFPDRENFGRTAMVLPAGRGVRRRAIPGGCSCAGRRGAERPGNSRQASWRTLQPGRGGFRSRPRHCSCDPRLRPELAVFGLAGGQLVRIAREEGLVRSTKVSLTAPIRRQRSRSWCLDPNRTRCSIPTTKLFGTRSTWRVTVASVRSTAAGLR